MRQHIVDRGGSIRLYDDIFSLKFRQDVYSYAIKSSFKIGWEDNEVIENSKHKYLHAGLSQQELDKLGILFNAVRTITGCDEITWFGGRIYSLIPGTDHYDTWHNDVVDYEVRLVGMSINLSPKGYEGGVFELRERAKDRASVQFANSGIGNARLFRIAPELQHQVTAVVGDRPRTAFAGWFYAGKPDLLKRLQDIAIGQTAN